jgi:hypothetical protein
MRLSVHLRTVVPALLLAFAAGCGGGEHDAMEKQLAELRAEVTRLRAGQAALSERVDTIEIDRGSFARGGASASPQAPAVDRDRPDLDVVRLSPSEGDGDADTADGSRPVIRAAGGGGEARPARGAGRGAPRRGVATAAPVPKKPQDSDTRPVVKP